MLLGNILNNDIAAENHDDVYWFVASRITPMPTTESQRLALIAMLLAASDLHAKIAAALTEIDASPALISIHQDQAIHCLSDQEEIV